MHWSYAGAAPGFGVHMVKWRTSKRHGNETFLDANQAYEHHQGWDPNNEAFQKLPMVRKSWRTAPAVHLRETVLAVRMQLLQVLSKLVKISGH